MEKNYIFCKILWRDKNVSEVPHFSSRERERVNKETKRMNSLLLSPLVISFILRGLLRDFIGKAAAYKSCVIHRVTLKR